MSAEEREFREPEWLAELDWMAAKGSRLGLLGWALQHLSVSLRVPAEEVLKRALALALAIPVFAAAAVVMTTAVAVAVVTTAVAVVVAGTAAAVAVLGTAVAATVVAVLALVVAATAAVQQMQIRWMIETPLG